MDQELELLLNRLRDDADSLTDDELATAEAGVLALGRELLSGDPSQEDQDAATDLVPYLGDIREARVVRADAAAARQANAAGLLAQFDGPDSHADTDTADTDVADTADTADEPGPVAVDEPVVPVAVDELPVAASGGRPALPPLRNLAARRPRRAAPVATDTADESGRAVLVAAADMPGLSAGAEVTLASMGRGIVNRINAVRRVADSSGDGDKIYFGTVQTTYPEDRRLTGRAEIDAAKIDAVLSPQALTASGGICGPVAVDYSITTLATAERPVRGTLVQFQASRGGVRFILPHTLAQVTVDAPASVWTETTDVTPGGSTKPHATFVCQNVTEAYVDAVTSIVQFGNFQARYFPEQIDQYMETVDAVHSRLAEATLLAAITSGSTTTVADHYVLGAARDILTTIDRAVAAYRYRHRAYGVTLRFMFPRFMLDMMRADLTREVPGDSGSGLERLAMTDQYLLGLISARGVTPTPYIDSPTGASALQGFGVQGGSGAQLLPWPATLITYLFHEGAWMFLDGGELNLGMVRDSTLNRTNDFQMFSESFEKAIFRGHESDVITMSVAPTGGSSGTVAVSAETVGS